MDGLSFVASVVASLAWPAVAVIVVLVFRKELGDLIERIRKGKIGSVEIEAGEFGQRLKGKLEANVEAPPATIALAGGAHGTGQAQAAITVSRTPEDSLAIADSVDAHVTKGSSFTADAILESLPRATSPEDLADSVSRYVELRTTPGLRHLSPNRIRLEQDFFGAALDLQSRRAQGARPADAARLALAVELIRTFWVRPELLSDEDVADGTALLRAVTAEMIGP